MGALANLSGSFLGSARGWDSLMTWVTLSNGEYTRQLWRFSEGKEAAIASARAARAPRKVNHASFCPVDLELTAFAFALSDWNGALRSSAEFAVSNLSSPLSPER